MERDTDTKTKERHTETRRIKERPRDRENQGRDTETRTKERDTETRTNERPLLLDLLTRERAMGTMEKMERARVMTPIMSPPVRRFTQQQQRLKHGMMM